MRIFLKTFGVVVVLLLVGFGCTFDDSQSKPLAVLTQGPPPADCGQRNPKKLTPYFAIPQPQIRVGESIYFDASCTVGRIAEVRWDFDFTAWPSSTPAEDRFETPNIIEHWDLQYPDYDNGDYDLNNFGPFYQTYTPTQSGTLTARLHVRDQKGREQTVISTYTVTGVHGDIAVRQTADFLLVDNNNYFYPKGTRDNPVYAYTNSLVADPIGAGGVVLKRDWAFSGEYVREGAVTTDVYEKKEVDQSKDSTILALRRFQGYPLNFELVPGRGRYDNLYRVESTITTAYNEKKLLSQYFYLRDLYGNDLIPQLFVGPDFAIASEGDTEWYAKNMYDVTGKLLLTAGDNFVMQNLSIFMNAQRENGSVAIGALTVDFDFGNGEFERVLSRDRLLDYSFTRNESGVPIYSFENFLSEVFVKKIYSVPVVPGEYVARMKIAQEAFSGPVQWIEKIVEVPYSVVAGQSKDFNVLLVMKPEIAYVDEYVTFDATGSTGNEPSYSWVVRNLLTGEARYEGGFSGLVSNGILSYRFTEPGTHRVTVTTKRLADKRPELAELDVEVRERKVEFGGELPDINPEIFPAGVARGGGLADQPSYINDRIIFSIPTLDATASKVVWDFESDGTVDVSCDVEVLEGGYVTCNRITKEPPHQTVGEVTATLFVSEKNGQGRWRANKTYYIVEQNRVITDQLGRPLN